MIKSDEIGIVNITTGKNVKIIKPVNLYECHLGDNVFIGPFVKYKIMLKLAMEVKYSHTLLFVN